MTAGGTVSGIEIINITPLQFQGWVDVPSRWYLPELTVTEKVVALSLRLTEALSGSFSSSLAQLEKKNMDTTKEMIIFFMIRLQQFFQTYE